MANTTENDSEQPSAPSTSIEEPITDATGQTNNDADTQTNTSSDGVDAAAQSQLEALKQEAQITLETLKNQEQQKLRLILSQMQNKHAQGQKPKTSNSTTQAPPTPVDAQSISPNPTKIPTSTLDEMMMEGRLLHPLHGLNKIRGVQQSQLNAMLGQINATLEITDDQDNTPHIDTTGLK